MSDNEILLKIYKEQQEIKKQLKIIPEVQQQLGVIPEMQKQLEVIPEMQKQLEAIPEMQKQLEEIPAIKEELRRISKTLARMEVDHGEKIQILFDAFQTHSQKFDRNDNKIKKIEERLDNHDNEIYILNSKVQGL